MSLKEIAERKILKPLERLWLKYKSYVETHTRDDSGIGSENISYWQEKLFTNMITYLLPVCLLALIPGIWMSLLVGYYFVAGFDLFTLGAIAVVALNRHLSLLFRKIFVVLMIYAVSLVLMLYIGMFGPGIIYLLAISVLVTLIFPRRLAYWSLAMNLVICVSCALLIDFNLFHSQFNGVYNIGAWIAIVSNLIFLCWVLVALIKNTIHSLESSIAKEFILKNQLQQETAEGTMRNRSIEESAGHYKSLFFISPLPMWVLDRENFRFLQVNKAATLEYGYSTEEFLSMTIQDIKMEEDMGAMESDLQKSLQSGKPLELVTRHRRKNGEIFYVEVRFNTIKFKGKDASLVILRDITQQVNYIQSIECHNKQFQDIAWMHAHSVRAPLARILGLVTVMNKGADEKQDVQLLAYLTESAKELDLVIRGITNSAKGL